MTENILEIRDLHVSFKSAAGLSHVLRGVNLSIPREKTVAIVGESGSGKSVTMRTCMGLLPGNATQLSGQVLFNQENLLEYTPDRFIREINGTRISMVFQNAMSALNPLMKIGDQIMDSILYHEKISKQEARGRAVELLKEVDIQDPEDRMNSYPHQMSGGQLQRVVIAIALSCNPEILICDEPTTALDVTTQERILDLIKTVQEERKISVVYITHNLGVVARVADYVNVMYSGKVIENGTAEDIFYDPKHPYTWGLLLAIPDAGGTSRRLYTLPGSSPDPLLDLKGDHFAVRNRYAMKIDELAEPPMFRVSDTHGAATWLLDPMAPPLPMPEELKHKIEKSRKSLQEGRTDDTV